MNIEGYLHEKSVEKEVESLQSELIKISVGVSENINMRLKYVAGELEIPRAELMRDLISMGLGAMEEHLELDPLDFDKPYANYVYSNIEEIAVGPLKFTKEQFIEMVKASRAKDGAKNE